MFWHPVHLDIDHHDLYIQPLIKGSGNVYSPLVDKETYLMYKREGLTDKQIADELFVTNRTITNYKNKWGLIGQFNNIAVHRKTESDYFDLKRKGLMDKEISELWGYKEHTALYRWKKRKGII